MSESSVTPEKGDTMAPLVPDLAALVRIQRERDEARAEVERLRGENVELREQLKQWEGGRDPWTP